MFQHAQVFEVTPLFPGHLDKAFSECVALSKTHRTSRKGPPPEVPPRVPAGEMNGIEPVGQRTLECAHLVAEWHLRRGSPIIAACALLAVDDVKVRSFFVVWESKGFFEG